MSRDELSVITLKIYATTEQATLYGPPGLGNSFADDKKKSWVPNAMISHRSRYDKNDVDEVELPTWLAEKKGFI